jgi:putative acetyltransferase
MIEIRAETSADVAAIREVNRRAFGQEDEGRIIDALRAGGGVLASLVATNEGRIVGHILYSPVRAGLVSGAALGPMAVVPERQGQGIGSRLVEAGNALQAGRGCPFIVLVGHPGFYHRFGFGPAGAVGLACEWDVPDGTFMVRILDRERMAGAAGMVKYRPEFNA